MEHVFSNKHRTIMGALPLVISFVTISSLIAMWVYHKNGDLVMSACAGLALIALMVLMIIKAPDYVVTENEVILKRKGKVLKQFPYKDYKMSPYVLKRYYCGVLIGTERDLITHDGKTENTTKIMLGKNEFDEFMALITAYSARSQ
jgi:hypothetical protein